jgi:hypothetical protein
VFLATAQAFDVEMHARIDRHRQERGNDFTTVEEPLAVAEVVRRQGAYDVLLVDCLTLWLSNLLLAEHTADEVLGRVDDVMNVSGHRLSTMEVESALVHHPAVAEAAVVAKPHEITGQAVCAFVTLKQGDWNAEQLGEELRQWVAREIGAFARPEEVRFTEALPKTRSGKIMRRLLREIVTSQSVTGDVTTLEDMNVIAQLSSQHGED